MSPFTRRRVAALLLLTLPVGLWALTANWHYELNANIWNWRTLWQLILATPANPWLYGSLAVGLLLAIIGIVFLGRAYRTEGFEGDSYKRFIRGTQSVTTKRLLRLCREPGVVQVDVAGIPMPTKLENLHLMIGGATGSGKSVLLRGLAASVCQRNDRMIVIDPNGDLMSKFWKDGDVILNPYDIRSQGWSFFNEIRADYDWKRLAHSMVPMSQDKNAEEWNDFGRLLLRETARKLYQTDPQRANVMDLFRLCTIEDPTELKKFLEGTLAESLFVGSSC